MANIKSAKKRVLVNDKKTEQNKMIRSAVKTQIKKIDLLVKEGKIEEADKIGIMLSSEIPILSNFNIIKDLEKGYEILETYINQTKAHPSLVVYCLGNEGAQLLVRDKESHEVAKKGYEIIKKNTKNQFGII